MDTTHIAMMNELLAAEQRNVVTSLMESTMFVSRLSLRAFDVLRSIARCSEENCKWLTEAILNHGGVPGPRVVVVAPADLHFQEPGVALPRVVQDRRALIGKYSMALRGGSEPAVTELLGRILERHRSEEASLSDLDSAPAPTIPS